MTGLLATVWSLPSATPLFAAKAGMVTAGQIRATALAIAAQLEPGKPVYLHTESAALFVASLAAVAVRGMTVFCPAHLQANYLREIGAESGAVLTDVNVDLASMLPLALATEDAPPRAFTGDLALTFYSSGTTAAPKQVRKAIAQLDQEAATLQAVWGGKAGAVYATVSHQHIYGMLFRIFWPVLSGRIAQDRPAETWEKLSGKLGACTTLVSSPAHLTRIPDSFGSCAPGLIFSSGAPLPFAAAQSARSRLGSLPFEVLGSTETGGIAWRQQDAPDALWTPFPDVATVVDAAGMLTVTSAVAGDETVVTGDLAEMAGDKFRLTGRGDRVVKIEGNRVSLPRVEAALLALPMIAGAAVVDLPQRKGALGAIVELTGDGPAALREIGAFRFSRKLRERLAGQLEPRERPKHWLFAPLPLDRQGKRVQAVLRAKFVQPGTDALGDLVAAAVDGDTAELTLHLLPDLVWFQGHFPNQPVLPGIAQVHLAAQWAECLWGFRPFGAHLAQLKFRRILRPGNKVNLTLTRDSARQRLSFVYTFDGIVASEGKIGGVP